MNFVYLQTRSRDFKRIEFVGIAPKATVAPGERLTANMLVPVGVPEASIGNLDDFAYRYENRNSVIDRRVWRMLEGGCLLIRDDLKTPPQALELGEDEAAIGVPVDSRAYPIALVVPGDQVSFLISTSQYGLPTAAVANPPEAAGSPEEAADLGADSGTEMAPVPDANASPGPSGPVETIGPFTVLSLGNRLGSSEVMDAARIPQMQGNVMTIRVKVDKDRKLVDKKAEKLVNLLYATNFRQVGILHFPQKR